MQFTYMKTTKQQIFKPFCNQLYSRFQPVVRSVKQHRLFHIYVKFFVLMDNIFVPRVISMRSIMIDANKLICQQGVRGSILNKILGNKWNNCRALWNLHKLLQFIIFEEHSTDDVVPVIIPRFCLLNISVGQRHLAHPTCTKFAKSIEAHALLIAPEKYTLVSLIAFCNIASPSAVWSNCGMSQLLKAFDKCIPSISSP